MSKSDVSDIGILESLCRALPQYCERGHTISRAFASDLQNELNKMREYDSIFSHRVDVARRSMDSCHAQQSCAPPNVYISCNSEESAYHRAVSDYGEYKAAIANMVVAYSAYKPSESRYLASLDQIQSQSVPELHKLISFLSQYTSGDGSGAASFTESESLKALAAGAATAGVVGAAARGSAGKGIKVDGATGAGTTSDMGESLGAFAAGATAAGIVGAAARGSAGKEIRLDGEPGAITPPDMGKHSQGVPIAATVLSGVAVVGIGVSLLGKNACYDLKYDDDGNVEFNGDIKEFEGKTYLIDPETGRVLGIVERNKYNYKYELNQEKDILYHVNRNFENKEAVGELVLHDDGKYYDADGCSWEKLSLAGTQFHYPNGSLLNSVNGFDGFTLNDGKKYYPVKFVRINPDKPNESYETIRYVPARDYDEEKIGGFTLNNSEVEKRIKTGEMDESFYQYVGTYNYYNGDFRTTVIDGGTDLLGLPRIGKETHYHYDVDPHNAGYKFYAAPKTSTIKDK